MSPEAWIGVAIQLITAVGAVAGAYLAIKVKLVELVLEVKAIYKEIARIDAELLRVRESIDRRRYVAVD